MDLTNKAFLALSENKSFCDIRIIELKDSKKSMSLWIETGVSGLYLIFVWYFLPCCDYTFKLENLILLV